MAATAFQSFVSEVRVLRRKNACFSENAPCVFILGGDKLLTTRNLQKSLVRDGLNFFHFRNKDKLVHLLRRLTRGIRSKFKCSREMLAGSKKKKQDEGKMKGSAGKCSADPAEFEPS